MQNVFKRYGVRATGSFNERFRYSLVKLTLLYVAVLALILFLSSSIIYSAFSNRLEYRFRNARPFPREYLIAPVAPPPTAEAVRTDLIYALILVNGLLLVVAGALSYLLARWTLQPIKNSYEQQQRFLSDASHELRTPLAILQIDMENVLSDTKTSAVAKEQTQSNLEEVKRMVSIVTDLLTLSRLDEHAVNQDGQVKTIDIHALITEVTTRLAGLAERQKVSVSFTRPAQHLMLTTHVHILSTALTNIIKNAISYNKTGGQVNISAIGQGHEVVIMVADTGAGVAKDDLKKIFDRFYRSDSSRSRTSGGSGLGLSIVQAAMHQLGGSVDMESEEGTGTTVTLRIPQE